MSTKTQYLIQAFFFLVAAIALFFLGKRRVSLLGAAVCAFVSALYFINAFRSSKRR